jgi:hypothetical protein
MSDADDHGGDERDTGPAADGGGDGHGDLRLRDDDDRKPSWLSTYGSPLWRILMLLALLAALVVLRKPCSDGVAGFVGNFGRPPGSQPIGDGGVQPASPSGSARPGMTQRSGSASQPQGQEGLRAPASGDAAPRK